MEDRCILTKFFRWLYNPDEPDQRKRITPPCMQGIKKLPRKEKTRYRHVDYVGCKRACNISKVYVLINETSAIMQWLSTLAPVHMSLLNLQISDLKFNITEEGKQYAELVIKQGKTGGRTVPLIDSIPYIKSWISDHPSGTNPDSWLFISKAQQFIRSKTNL